jgi:hypothetical protein
VTYFFLLAMWLGFIWFGEPAFVACFWLIALNAALEDDEEERP